MRLSEVEEKLRQFREAHGDVPFVMGGTYGDRLAEHLYFREQSPGGLIPAYVLAVGGLYSPEELDCLEKSEVGNHGEPI